MVPGGAIVAGQNKRFINAIAQNYPGRASISPILTFHHFAVNGLKNMEGITKSAERAKYSQEVLQPIAEKYGERLLITKGNAIS